jgi:hypothetical protein
MTDARRYDVFLTKPAAGSKYEFLLHGFACVFNVPPLWVLPVEITDDMSLEDAAYWRSGNEMDVALRRAVVQRLRESGITKDRLQEPLSDHVGRLVDELVAGVRSALRQRELQAPLAPPMFDVANGTYERGLCARVVAAAILCIEGRNFEKTAEYLNAGRSAGAKGLDRYHVGRAFKIQKKRLLQLSLISGLDAALACVTIERAILAALNVIHDEARNSGVFGHIHGAELAAAINGGFDLRECVCRRLDVLARERELVRAA